MIVGGRASRLPSMRCALRSRCARRFVQRPFVATMRRCETLRSSRCVACAGWICECPSSRSRARPTTMWCGSPKPPMSWGSTASSGQTITWPSTVTGCRARRTRGWRWARWCERRAG